MSDNEEFGLEDKLKLPENCSIGLRRYLYFIAAAAVVILIGTYWSINHYNDAVHGSALLNGLGMSGNPPVAANAPAAANAPVPNRVAANQTTPITSNRAMAQNVGRQDFATIAMAMRGSVVNISTTGGGRNRPKLAATPGADTVRFANPFSPRSRGSIGSGVIIRNDGYIISNYHIVRGASSATVTVFTNQGTQRYKADIVKMDETMDLVLLKIKTSAPLPAAALANSTNVRVADEVIAIGSPFGLDQTVSRGIVSALRKSMAIEGITHSDLIQTDAAINQGNSGGPLIDTQGKVVGINTAIYTPTGAFSGIGFAIPSNQIRKFMQDEMGQPLQAARSFNAAAPNAPAPAIRASATIPGNHRNDGRANMACDSCHKIIGQPTGQAAAFQTVKAPRVMAAPTIRANSNPPGNHRNDGRVNMVCTTCHQVAGQPTAGAAGQQAAFQFAAPPTSLALNVAAPNGAAFGVPGANYTILGAGLMPISAALAERLNHPQDRGVFVSQVISSSPAAQAGLQAGDIILKVGGRRVWAPGQLGVIVKDMTNGETLRLGILRDDKRSDIDMIVTAVPTDANINQPSAVATPRTIPNEFNWRGINVESFITIAPPKRPGEPSVRGAEVDGVSKGSPAEKAGLRTRDVILKINSQPVGMPGLLDNAIRNAKGQTSILLMVMRDGREFFVVLP